MRVTASDELLEYLNVTGQWSKELVARDVDLGRKTSFMAYRRRVVDRLWRMHHPDSDYGRAVPIQPVEAYRTNDVPR